MPCPCERLSASCSCSFMRWLQTGVQCSTRGVTWRAQSHRAMGPIALQSTGQGPLFNSSETKVNLSLTAISPAAQLSRYSAIQLSSYPAIQLPSYPAASRRPPPLAWMSLATQGSEMGSNAIFFPQIEDHYSSPPVERGNMQRFATCTLPVASPVCPHPEGACACACACKPKRAATKASSSRLRPSGAGLQGSARSEERMSRMSASML